MESLKRFLVGVHQDRGRAYACDINGHRFRVALPKPTGEGGATRQRSSRRKKELIAPLLPSGQVGHAEVVPALLDVRDVTPVRSSRREPGLPGSSRVPGGDAGFADRAFGGMEWRPRARPPSSSARSDHVHGRFATRPRSVGDCNCLDDATSVTFWKGRECVGNASKMGTSIGSPTALS